MLSSSMRKKLEKLLDEMLPVARNYVAQERERQERAAEEAVERESILREGGEPPPLPGGLFIPPGSLVFKPPPPPEHHVASAVRDWLEACESARRLQNDDVAVECAARALLVLKATLGGSSEVGKP